MTFGSWSSEANAFWVAGLMFLASTGFMYTFITNIAHNDHHSVNVAGLTDVHNELHRREASMDGNMMADMVSHDIFCDTSEPHPDFMDEWLVEMDPDEAHHVCIYLSNAAHRMHENLQLFPWEDSSAGAAESRELTRRYVARHGNDGHRRLQQHYSDHISHPDYHKEYIDYLHGNLLNETHHEMLHATGQGRRLMGLHQPVGGHLRRLSEFDHISDEELKKRMSHFRKWVNSGHGSIGVNLTKTITGLAEPVVDLAMLSEPVVYHLGDNDWVTACNTNNGVCGPNTRIHPGLGDTVVTENDNLLGSRFAGIPMGWSEQVPRGGEYRSAGSTMGIGSHMSFLPYEITGDSADTFVGVPGLKGLTDAEIAFNKGFQSLVSEAGANKTDLYSQLRGMHVDTTIIAYDRRDHKCLTDGEISEPCAHKARRLAHGLYNGDYISRDEAGDRFIISCIAAGVVAAAIAAAAAAAAAATAAAAALAASASAVVASMMTAVATVTAGQAIGGIGGLISTICTFKDCVKD